MEQLTIFQRTAQWILPNRLYHTPVPAGDAWALRHLPFYGRWYRFVMTFASLAAGMEMLRIDPAHEDPTHQSINTLNARRAKGLLASMQSIVGDDPELLARVVPDYPATGKRILQDDGTWLRTLQRPDVELVRTGIERVVADGLVTTDGRRYPADVICYATGFRHNEFLGSMRVIGRNGVSLHDQWGEEPTGYLGMTMPNFHLFCIYGPGTNLAFGASLFYHASSRSTTPWRPCTRRWRRARSGARCGPRHTMTTPSAIGTRSASWCGRIPPSRTATTRTATARSSRCHRGHSTSTGPGPATSARSLPLR